MPPQKGALNVCRNSPQRAASPTDRKARHHIIAPISGVPLLRELPQKSSVT
jgi:hypothetical protein